MLYSSVSNRVLHVIRVESRGDSLEMTPGTLKTNISRHKERLLNGENAAKGKSNGTEQEKSKSCSFSCFSPQTFEWCPFRKSNFTETAIKLKQIILSHCKVRSPRKVNLHPKICTNLA